MNKLDLSISMEAATRKSLTIAVPIAVSQIIIFIVIQKFPKLPADANLVWFALALLAGIFAHELIHVLTWMLFAHKPLRAFKLGFQWKALTPYAHCNEPMDIFPYRVGSFTPGLLLGLVPWFGSLFTGDVLLLFFGLAYTSAAGGDFLILWLLRKINPNTLVEDHPSNAGCYIYEP
jgi:hypothetical protein